MQDVIWYQRPFFGRKIRYNAAKLHSDDLIARDAQDHINQFERVLDAGFFYMQARGNVFSYTKDAVYGHAGFNMDWGYGTGGMQDGRGHRMAIMSIDGDYSNVGLAIVPVSGSATTIGPLVTTGNYCSANTLQSNHYNRFLVGTVWNDINENERYDPGEGAGNVTVMPDSGTYYAITSDSGGYAIPISSAGTYRVTFSGTQDAIRDVTVENESVLLDLIFTPSEVSNVYVGNNGDCGSKTPCYDSIQNAIDNVATDSIILVKQGTYTESLRLETAKIILIQGGYNSAYDQQTANTTFIQSPSQTFIQAPNGGSLKFQMIGIK